MKPEFTVKLIRNTAGLKRLSDQLLDCQAFALDIETSDWWNRHREQIALIQFAFRAADDKIKVGVVDPLADLNINKLRLPLENPSALKIIHNAAFDAVRLQKHYNFRLTSIYDTMIAARRSGERKHSLKAQASLYLDLHLDKTARNSDWSRRPLDYRQLHYAALDPYAALLLYEHQTSRGLAGDYRLKPPAVDNQTPLPFGKPTKQVVPKKAESSESERAAVSADSQTENDKSGYKKAELPEEAIALLGIISELPTRYSPGSLAVSAGGNRVGLTGWIIDRRLGGDAEPDEETVKLAISRLCDKNLVAITETGRLKATMSGENLWRSLK